MAYINNLGQVRIGVRGWVAAQSGASVTDSDATAFVTAAGITDSTQISALNTLVTDLKTYGLWTKMKAIYPFVGGSAASHKFNLKDPRDLDAAYRLVFNGGWVHSSNGALPNGTTGYANTFLVPSSVQTLNSNGFGYYTPSTNTSTSTDSAPIGSYTSPSQSSTMGCTTTLIKTRLNNNLITSSTLIPTGLLSAHKTSNTLSTLYKNSSNVGSGDSGGTLPNYPIFFGTANVYGVPYNLGYVNNEFRLTYVSDGLDQTEISNFYISVQKFQTTLGRHVGTPYVSDPDAIAFLMAAGITDGTQAAAINTLVIRMKADGVWTKMKAIYPFVGGSAASHKWNLKDPRDLDAAFRLVFNGGWVHSSTGAKPNGTTGYYSTSLNPSNSLSTNNVSLTVYLRTDYNDPNGVVVDFGTPYYGGNVGVHIYARSTNIMYVRANSYPMSYTNNDSLGLHGVSRLDGTNLSFVKNSSFSTTGAQSFSNSNNIIYGAYGGYGYYSPREHAFSSIGDGLTATESSNLYSAVQAFQTTLGRQVNVPLVSDTDAQAFLNAANITSYQQASAVNKLVVDLKAAGVWTKMKAIYPFVGGSAASHKFNLKDPRDLDAAYRLVFNGGWTHTSTGALPNGTTGYADTKLNQNDILQINNEHISVYLRTNSLSTTVDIGLWGGSHGSQIFSRANAPSLSSNDIFVGYAQQNFSVYSFVTNTDSRGFYMTNRSNSTIIRLQKNTTITPFNINSYGKVSLNFTLGARNNMGTNDLFSSREQSFASIGDGLTDAESTALYTAVETYQTSLGRGVNTPIYNNGLVLNLDAGNANSYPGTGTTWFDLATSTNGTLVNSPTFNSNQFTFNGSQYVNFGNVNNIGTDSVTLVAWIKTIANQDYAGIIGKAFYGAKPGRFSLHTRTGGKLGIITQRLQNSNVEVTSTQNINTGNWVFVVGVIDRSYGNKLYINGVLDGVSTEDTSGVNWSTTDNFTIGFYNGNGSGYFNGSISNAFMYRKVLTDTEIMNLYNSTRGRFGL